MAFAPRHHLHLLRGAGQLPDWRRKRKIVHVNTISRSSRGQICPNTPSNSPVFVGGKSQVPKRNSVPATWKSFGRVYSPVVAKENQSPHRAGFFDKDN